MIRRKWVHSGTKTFIACRVRIYSPRKSDRPVSSQIKLFNINTIVIDLFLIKLINLSWITRFKPKSKKKIMKTTQKKKMLVVVMASPPRVDTLNGMILFNYDYIYLKILHMNKYHGNF